MKGHDIELTEAIGALAEAERQRLEEHPTTAKLTAYQAGELSPNQVEQLRDHLACCPDCSDQLLDLIAADEAATSASALLAREQLDSDLRSTLGRLVKTQTGQATSPTAPVPISFWQSRVLSHLLAASLAAVAVGLTLWALQDRPHPQANVRIIDLIPIEEQGYRGWQSDEIAFDSTVPALLLILNLSDLSEHADYQAELLARDGSDEPLLVVTGLTRAPGGNFTLEIARGTLPPGEYRIKLFGVDEGRRAVLAEYLVQLALGL